MHLGTFYKTRHLMTSSSKQSMERSYKVRQNGNWDNVRVYRMWMAITVYFMKKKIFPRTTVYSFSILPWLIYALTHFNFLGDSGFFSWGPTVSDSARLRQASRCLCGPSANCSHGLCRPEAVCRYRQWSHSNISSDIMHTTVMYEQKLKRPAPVCKHDDTSSYALPV